MSEKTSSQQHAQFLRAYENYVRGILKPTQDALKDIFTSWRQPDYWPRINGSSRRAAPTPVQRAHTRVKRPESVVDKILRKRSKYPDGLTAESIAKMSDTLAGRVVTYFRSGFPLIDNELRNHPNLEIVEEDPPVAYLEPRLLETLGLGHIQSERKESGYSSIHYVVRVKSAEISIGKSPNVEIQVRTLAEDVWSEVEHLLGYKPGKHTSFSVRKQFAILSSHLAAIDDHFNFLYDELLRFQDEVEVEDSDPLNAENLPSVLAECGIGCAQREIDGLLKLLFSRGITSVSELRGLATPELVDRVRHIYRNHEGRDAINYEVVACLGAVGSTRDVYDAESVVRAQIDYLKGWVALKRDIRSR